MSMQSSFPSLVKNTASGNVGGGGGGGGNSGTNSQNNSGLGNTASGSTRKLSAHGSNSGVGGSSTTRSSYYKQQTAAAGSGTGQPGTKRIATRTSSTAAAAPVQLQTNADAMDESTESGQVYYTAGQQPPYGSPQNSGIGSGNSATSPANAQHHRGVSSTSATSPNGQTSRAAKLSSGISGNVDNSMTGGGHSRERNSQEVKQQMYPSQPPQRSVKSPPSSHLVAAAAAAASNSGSSRQPQPPSQPHNATSPTHSHHTHTHSTSSHTAYGMVQSSSSISTSQLAAQQAAAAQGQQQQGPSSAAAAAMSNAALVKPSPPKPKPPMTPAETMRKYGDLLTPFEQSEILEYQQIYFVGTNLRDKIKGIPHTALNNGYDDDRGDYRITSGDHLEYRYEILNILGRGSFGQVLKVFDHKKDIVVALKIIRNKKRFHHQALVEVKILEHLMGRDKEHKSNIVRVYGYFYFRNHLCITFEPLSINLYEFIKNNNFKGISLGLIRRFALQLLQSLKFLKGEKIIHCFGEDTRVLTSEGFLGVGEIEERLKQQQPLTHHHSQPHSQQHSQSHRQPLLYACYDVATKSIVYRPGKLVYPPNREGRLMEFGWRSNGEKDTQATNTQQHSLRVTSNHDMYAAFEPSSSPRFSPSHSSPLSYTKHSASSLATKSHDSTFRMLAHAQNGVLPQRHTSSSPLLSYLQPLNILPHTQQEDAFLRVFGLVLRYADLTTDSIRIPLSSTLISSWLTQQLTTIGLLQGVDYDFLSNDCTIHNPTWMKYFKQEFSSAFESVFPPWITQQADQRMLRLILEGFTQRDSHHLLSSSSHTITTTSIALRDQLLQILFHAGFSAWFEKSTEESEEWIVKYEDHSLSENTTSTASSPSFTSTSITSTPYASRLWCVTLDHTDHLLIAQHGHYCPTTNQLLSVSPALITGNCDLKPENILLKSPNKSTIKLIDFGSSCFEDERVYTYIQSRFYRSPEVILGLPYDISIDMWSFGCILSELYTGYPLFPGENEIEQMQAIMEVLGPPPKRLIQECTRKKAFFDATGKPLVVPNTRGKIRTPASKDLAMATKCNDPQFLSFLRRCFGKDTRVLTIEGWKGREEVERRERMQQHQQQKPLLYACYSTSQRQIVYTRGKLIVSQNIHGKLVNFTPVEERKSWSDSTPSVSSVSFSLRVTPDHDMFASRDSQVEFKRVRAEDLLSSSSSFNLLSSASRGVSRSLDDINHLNELLSSSHNLVTEEQRTEFFTQHGTWLATTELPQLLPFLLTHATAEQSRFVLDGFTASSSPPDDITSHSFITTSSPFRDDFIQLCMHAGYTACFSAVQNDSFSWRINYSSSSASASLTTPLLHPSTDMTYDSYTEPEVWCIEVEHPDHLIFAQRVMLSTPTADSKSLPPTILRTSLPLIVSNCLRWDPKVRMTPEKAFEHPWISEATGVAPPVSSQTGRKENSITPTYHSTASGYVQSGGNGPNNSGGGATSSRGDKIQKSSDGSSSTARVHGSHHNAVSPPHDGSAAGNNSGIGADSPSTSVIGGTTRSKGATKQPTHTGRRPSVSSSNAVTSGNKSQFFPPIASGKVASGTGGNNSGLGTSRQQQQQVQSPQNSQMDTN